MSKHKHIRPGHRTWMLAGPVVVLLLIPAVVYAGHRFNDVPSSHIFHADIDWLEQSGVTRGCNPPENNQYCPDDPVTRGQMAAFMRRLSEGRIVAADTANRASDADSADALDGRTREQLLGGGTGNQQLRDSVLTPSEPQIPDNGTLTSEISAASNQGSVVFSHFSGFIVQSELDVTAHDHQFVCWISTSPLTEFDPAELNGYWWRTYPAGTAGVFGANQHSIPFSFTFARFIGPGQSITLYPQCADLISDAVPAEEHFLMRGQMYTWWIPAENNVFQPTSPDSDNSETSPSLQPATAED